VTKVPTRSMTLQLTCKREALFGKNDRLWHHQHWMMCCSQLKEQIGGSIVGTGMMKGGPVFAKDNIVLIAGSHLEQWYQLGLGGAMKAH
jgi:hypothetical protein